MKEIKFRFWDKILNKWVYITLQELCCTNISWYDSDNWCEFTGLYDKNGKEIYEGDIIKIIQKSVDEIELIQTVEWIKGTGCYSIIIYNIGTYLLSDLENKDGFILEVIGNIFETPELLKCKVRIKK